MGGRARYYRIPYVHSPSPACAHGLASPCRRPPTPTPRPHLQDGRQHPGDCQQRQVGGQVQVDHASHPVHSALQQPGARRKRAGEGRCLDPVKGVWVWRWQEGRSMYKYPSGRQDRHRCLPSSPPPGAHLCAPRTHSVPLTFPSLLPPPDHPASPTHLAAHRLLVPHRAQQ